MSGESFAAVSLLAMVRSVDNWVKVLRLVEWLIGLLVDYDSLSWNLVDGLIAVTLSLSKCWAVR